MNINRSVVKHAIQLSVIVLGFCLLVQCSRKTVQKPKPDVIARVGASVITTDDFKYRTGLTVRPSSVRTVNAALNNLIAEKLLAMEARDSCVLLKDPAFQAHIQGIREQAMREQLYNEVAVNKVRINEEELNRTFRLSKRAYDLEFFTINNPKIIEEVESQQASGLRPEEIFAGLKRIGESGFQTVGWRDPENDYIHRALYERAHGIGDIIGPVHIADMQWVMMRVVDVNIHPIIGPEDTQFRMNEVRNKLTELKAKSIWQEYKNSMMSGKEIKYDPEVLKLIVEWYLEDQNQSPTGEISQTQKNELEIQLKKDTPKKLNAIMDRHFFRLDGQSWTVGDFKRAIMSHPLIYQKKEFPPNQFPAYFKRAVADMIVDHYLNKEAYRRGLDKQEAVQKKGKQWEDSYLARWEINRYLEKINVNELQKKDYTYYGPRAINEYLAQLNVRYKDQIEVHEEYLRKMHLNKVPVFALQPGMPYPMAVPGFPHFTNTDTLLFQ